MILPERKVVMKKLLSCLLIISACTLLITAAAPVYSQKTLPEYGSVLRFHIRANSDSEKDQSIKLSVRDAIVEYAGFLTKNCTDADEARAVLLQRSEAITSLADHVLRECGVCYGSSFKLVTERFPEKTYGGVVFPEGVYDAVRIDLGSGRGHNFWCVLFPPICLADACTEDVLDEYGVEDFYKADEKPRFIIKLKIWEDIKKLFCKTK